MNSAIQILSILLITIISDLQTGLCCASVALIAQFIFHYLFDKALYNVYCTTFSFLLVYVSVCYLYMRVNNFSYLLMYDTDHVFIPNTKLYIEGASSYIEVVKKIWQDYNIFNRFQVGFYTIITLFAFVSQLLNADIYITIQVGLVSICAISSTFIYKILDEVGICIKNKKLYSLVISACSPLFLYSATILRDGLIAVLILFCFVEMLQPCDIKRIIIVITTIFLITTMRIETGIMMLIFIPFYVFGGKIHNKYFTYFSIICVAILLLYLLIFYSTNIEAIYTANYENYTDGVSSQSGIIGSIQKLPIGISHILSIIYTALNPIPCWSKLLLSYNRNLPECYNIMLFPTAIFSIFNLFMIICLLIGILSKIDIKEKIKNINFLIFPALICLALQSAIVQQRRIMALYVVFYIIAFVFYENMTKSNRRLVYSLTVLLCVFINFVGAMIL